MGVKKIALKASDYVHLHNHSHYSLLDGLTKLPALVEHVKNSGMEAIALTDHGTMSGAIDFYKAAKANGIKPIIGMEAYIAPRDHTDKEADKDRQYYHLTMLAMNQAGYENLMKLSTIANLEGFYYKPRIDRELIQKYSEGIIVLSGCIGGEVSDALRQNQFDQAKRVATWYKKVFSERYFIELQDHGHPDHPKVWDEQDRVNQELLKIADELKIPAVVTGDAHYLKKEDKDAHEVLLCVQTGSFLDEKDRFSLRDFDLYVADPKEVITRWGNTHPDLITNTRKIADLCDVEIELGKILIPKFPVPKNETEKTLLEKLVWQGLAWRYGGKPRSSIDKLSIDKAKRTLDQDIIDRADYELSVVSRMGFNGYFLIVADFINWGKEQGIVFGPGRGSAASSIMAYAMRITEINPMEYDLLFERFLNPDRISMPDMDIDIQDSRRDEVINYCVEKYGRDRVANIVTFGSMAARNSVRDVARVLQVPYADADRLAKMIPPPIQGRHTLLAVHLKQVKELKDEYKTNEQSRRVFDLAIKLEGTIRSHGVHAAGVVIATNDIVDFVPLEMAQKGVIATQYSMGPIEDLGLLKIDFLGLSNLTTIKNTLRIIRKVHGLDIDIDNIPLDDKKTFELLQKGETTGVFQLESSGMKRYLKQLIPTTFEDIIAMVSLYRPGPLSAGLTDKFIARKNGYEKVKYDHKLMENSLKNTYGVIVYQEQVMQIVKDMCGFSGGEADTLRKAMGKKQREMMAKLQEKVIEGAAKNGVDKKVVEKFWQDLQGFADYAFNKSHAACYALIAYQTGYLKANYPDAFMAALMTSDYDNIDRLAIEISECKHMGIEVLPPDVNQSFHEFAVVPKENKIRFGMDAVKNVGHGSVEEIIKAREIVGGKFSSLEEYCQEVSVRVVNRKNLESLIKAGAFDSFGDRGILLNNVENILAFAARTQKDSASGQVDLFSLNEKENIESMPKLILNTSLPNPPENEQLVWERELLGLYLSSHPLENYEDILNKQTTPITKILPESEGRQFTIGGTIMSMREITTKTGAKMAFVRIGDMTGDMEIVIFPKVYQQSASLIQRDNIVLVDGKVSSGRAQSSVSDSELKLLADNIRSIDSYKSDSRVNVAPESTKNHQQRLYIRLEDSNNQSVLVTLKEKLDSHRGETEVVLITGSLNSKQIIKLPQSISVNEESLRSIAALFGPTNVVVK